MNTIGFPNTDIYSEHEHGGAESFWPSFTDIMMVIVMTFLLISVAVILNNWELVNNLKESIAAERKAAVRAQTALQAVQTKEIENETLEQRLTRLEQLLASRSEMLAKSQQKVRDTQQSLQASASALESVRTTLASTRAKLADAQTSLGSLQENKLELEESLEAAKLSLENQQHKLNQVEAEKKEALAAAQQIEEVLTAKLSASEEKVNLLAATESRVRELEQQLNERRQAISQLQEKDIEGRERLLSLQGEYEALDKKYQKLLRPARSDKGKHVVRVVYTKTAAGYSYQLLEGEKSVLSTSSKTSLEQSLEKFKEKYGDDLYVKIIIPESSSLSHTDAWKFTSEILNRYDYYYADEKL